MKLPSQCLKITENVYFNIATEACGQTVLPDSLNLPKMMENAKIEKFKCDIFVDFQTILQISENFKNLAFGQKLAFKDSVRKWIIV